MDRGPVSSPIDLDALEQLAKGATPGPWHQDERNPERIETAGLRLVAISNAWPSGQVKIDGAYLASLSPDRILSMIQRLKLLALMEEPVSGKPHRVADEDGLAWLDAFTVSAHPNTPCRLQVGFVRSLVERLRETEANLRASDRSFVQAMNELIPAQAQRDENLRLWQLSIVENDRKAVRIRELTVRAEAAEARVLEIEEQLALFEGRP